MKSEGIFIVTEAGRGRGFGHLTRCLSIYQAFLEKGFAPALLVNGDDTIKGLIKDMKYDIFDWASNAEKLFKLIKNARIVIVDSYLAGQEMFDGMAEIDGTCAYIDDAGKRLYRRGVVINPNIYAKEMSYEKKSGIEYLAGSSYACLRRHFWDIETRNISKDANNILLTFGGWDSKNMSSAVLGELVKQYPEIRKTVAVGAAFEHADTLMNIADRNTELVSSPDDKMMLRLMMEADIAISTSGQVLFELAATGLPAITIAVAENQMDNGRAWYEAGFSEFAGWYKDGAVEKALKALEWFLAYSERLRRSNIGRRLVDGKGAGRVIDLLLKRAAGLELIKGG